MQELKALEVTPRDGKEAFEIEGVPISFSVFDFWRWSVSDLVSNATRGKLAEFIVATAVGIDWSKVRDEWDDYDLLSDQGVKIEVKSAAYIQTWRQSRYSTISFSIKKNFRKTVGGNNAELQSGRYADVYVFCLLKHRNKETINPMELSQWEFYVVPVAVINGYTRSESSITLNSLERLAAPVPYDGLKDAILKAGQDRLW